MTTAEGPRRATSEEFPEMMRLVDRCFRKTEGAMAARLPFCYDERHPERHAIVRQDGEIVAHAAAIPQTLVIGDDAVDCPGIGGVATDPRFRGNGHMTSLLEFWMERLEAPMIELGGDRQRYGRFGWENAGREFRFFLTSRSIPDEAGSSPVTEYEAGEGQIDRLHRIHGGERLRVERSREETKRVHDRAGNVTLLTTGDTGAYVSFSSRSSETTVTEFGGSGEKVVDLLATAFDWYDLESATVFVPPEHPITPTIRRVASSWKLTVQRKLFVDDLPAVLAGFESQMERRWSRSGLSSADVCLGITGDDNRARLVFDDGVDVERTTAEPDASLERREMTHLLFGLSGVAWEQQDEHPVLRAVLPLDYYIWASERV